MRNPRTQSLLFLAGILHCIFALASVSNDSFSVMSFNLRHSIDCGTLLQPKNTEDEECKRSFWRLLRNQHIAWENRRPAVIQLIKEHSPDILGVQEMRNNQDMQQYMHQHLQDAYAVFTVESGEQGDKKLNTGAPLDIFYKKDRFAFIDGGFFWLTAQSEKRYQNKKPDDVANRSRLAFWVILADRRNQQEYFIVNTHLKPFKGKENIQQREQGARAIREEIEKRSDNRPIIVLGDMNTYPGRKSRDKYQDGTYHILTQKNGEFYLCDADPTDRATHNSFEKWEKAAEKSRLDYIFHSGNLSVEKADVIVKTYEEASDDKDAPFYPSDHFPVLATFAYLPPGASGHCGIRQ